MRLVILGTILFTLFESNKCKKLDGYKFPVYSTPFCPRNESEWDKRSSVLNCNRTNGYTCLPNEKFTELLEFCYRNPSILIEKGVCLYLKKKDSYVYSHSCHPFKYGCPNNSYRSINIFEYPSCISIGNGCFLAEQFCKSSPNTTYQSDTTDNDNDGFLWVVIVIGVIVFVFCFSICMLYRRRKKHTVCKKCTDIESTDESKERQPFIKNKKDSAKTEEIKEKEKTAVPWNVKEIYKKVVSEWKKKDDVYFPTHSFPTMFDQVKNQPYVTFVGTPGSGKSATAHHIALKLQNEEGYDILPITEVSKIEDYCDPESPQVFVIDDVVGVFGLNKGQFEMLEKYEDRIISAEMSKTKIIMTCREVVFRNETLSKCFLTKKANVIQLQSEDNKLSDEDKRSLLANYGLKAGLIPSKRMSETSSMFPFLCKMFSEQKRFSDHGYRFFITPVKYLKDELDKMQTRNKIHYVSLVLLMLHQNKLSKTELLNDLIENKPIDIKDVFKKCKVSKHTESFEIADAIKEMDGTYTQTCDDQFCFIHDSMFEIVACQFGRQFPELVIKYMSSEYIAYYIKVGTNDGEKNVNKGDEMLENKEHLTITLHKSKLPMLAERLFIDLKDGKFIRILEYLKHPSVMQAFQKLIKEKQYDELFTAFLSNQEGSKYYLFYIHFTLFAQTLLVENRNSTDVECLLTGGIFNIELHSKSMRAIRWFVFGGQHGILQHIIDQMMIHKGNINDLFLTLCSKEQQSGQGVNNTGTEIERTEDDDTTVETTTTKNKIQKKSTLCFKNADTDKEIANNDLTRTGYRDSESDSKSDIDTNREEMIVEQWRLLCLGCHSGDVNTVKILLKYVNKAALSMHKKNSLGFRINNPLTVACINGYFDIAKELIRSGANSNPHIKYEQSHLSTCLSRGHWDIAKELIKAGADVNKGNACSTPLKEMCEMNNLSAVRLLIKAGADLNPKYKSPLQASFDCKNLKIAGELIKAGANANSDIDINPNQKKTSTKYKTPLIIACENSGYHTVRLLIKEGADIHKGDGHRTPLAAACQNRNLKIIKMLIKTGADVNPMNAKMSPLMVACYDGELKCVQDWIKKGALLNLKTENGTPLLFACKQSKNSVFEELIKEGADVNLEAKGEIPLTVAINKMFIECEEENRIYRVKSLIQARADVNLKVGDKTPLLVACQNRYTSIVEVLIQAGANVNLEIGDKTPLLVACQSGYTSTVEVLIKAGANINLKVGDKTPLIVACRRGHTSMVEVLIKEGADVNLEAEDQTPLTTVLNFIKHKTNREEYHENKLDEVKVLLQAGADFNQKAGKKTPLIVACQKGYTDVVDEFIKTQADYNLVAQNKTLLTDVCKKTNTNVKESFDKMENILGLQYKSQLLTACLRKQLTIADLIKTDSITCKDDDIASLASKCLIKHLGENEQLIKWAHSNAKNILSFLLKTACQIGHFNLVKELIEVAVDINLVDENETPLIIACQRGHVSVIKELIEAGADVNMGAGCNYPLTVACEKMHIDAVKELIEAGADVNLKGSNKTPLTTAASEVNMIAADKTPLIIVCERKNIDAARLLIESGAEVNLAARGVTPLTAACTSYNLDVVEELIKAGAKVNQTDSHRTPLTTAIYYWMLENIELVIKAGADVNLKDKDQTPLTLACQKGKLHIIAALINAGADVNLKARHKTPLTVACTEGHFDVVKYLIQRGACVNLDDGFKTPLEIAYERKCMRIAEYLVNAGASFNLIKDVFAPIRVACQMGRINDVKKMIKAGTELNPTNVDKTPMTVACQNGDLSLVKELINAGASVDLMDRFSTPLTTACLWGHLGVVKELINRGASVDKIDKYNTPLTTACIWGHLDIVKELIRAGSNVNLRDVSNTPLTTACYWKELDIVKELIESDADVNLQDEENTPLTIACLNNRIDIVKELIKAKANVNVEAGCNTPLTAACEGGDRCIVEMLIKAGADVNLGVEIETTDKDE